MVAVVVVAVVAFANIVAVVFVLAVVVVVIKTELSKRHIAAPYEICKTFNSSLKFLVAHKLCYGIDFWTYVESVILE